jgi:hypothetical protein
MLLHFCDKPPGLEVGQYSAEKQPGVVPKI